MVYLPTILPNFSLFNLTFLLLLTEGVTTFGIK